MKFFLKTLDEFFFILIFLVFLILGTLRFELLNSAFIFSSLERHHIYQQIPAAFAKIIPNDPNISNLPPGQIKQVVVRDLSSLLNYMDGKTKDFEIAIVPSEVGFPPGVVLFWSSAQNQGAFEILHGLNKLFFLGWLVFLIIIVFFYFALKQALFLFAGSLLLILGGIARVWLAVITANTPMREPAQILLVFASKSILVDITYSWIILGSVMIGLWYYLKNRKNNSYIRKKV